MKKRKKILLTTPRFYTYPDILREAMEDLGFEVCHLYYPKTGIYMPVYPLSITNLLKRLYSFFKNDFDDFSRYCISQLESANFDYLVSINIPVSARLIYLLKKENKYVKTIFYLWDPLCKYKILPYISIYDKLYTFDPKDAIEHNLNYKINYWNIGKSVGGSHVYEKFDLVFVGKFSKYRADILISILQNNPDLKFYVRLFKKQSENDYMYKHWINKKNADYQEMLFSILIEESIDINFVNTIILASKGIIDIEISPQYGLSQRVIYALGNKKKIITTNPYLLSKKEYKEQVLDVNKVGKVKIKEWLDKTVTEYALYDDIQRSEVHNWLTDVLEL